MEKTKRIGWIDSAKGILICLVVLGHIISDSNIPLQNWIYSFHIPAFLILEGITVSITESLNRDFREFIKRNLSGLIYPYVVFSVLFLLRSFIQYAVGSLSLIQIGNYFLMLISFCGVGILWFLPTLFCAKLLFYITYKRKLYAIFGVVFIASLSICVFAQQVINCDSNIFSLSSVIVFGFRSILAAGFISVGYFIFSLYKKLTIKRYIMFVTYIVCAVVSVVFYRFNGTVDLHIMLLHNPILYLVFAISVFGVARVLARSKVLLLWGKNSIVIMLTHTIFGVYKIVLILCEKVVSFYPLIIAFSFIVVMAVESLLILIIMKKFNWLIKPSFSLSRKVDDRNEFN